LIFDDLTGLNKSSGGEGESLRRRAGYADEEVQPIPTWVMDSTKDSGIAVLAELQPTNTTDKH
jgi:hypothetical protein